ncbi:hypothetical protein NDI52_28915 [Leptolyngbya sp. PL-A3]|uniref:hypothetical protein n=1 Tax=Leptolyngbya sp. PL-A3 TaxID=2933911 RepID=UPI0032999E1C
MKLLLQAGESSKDLGSGQASINELLQCVRAKASDERAHMFVSTEDVLSEIATKLFQSDSNTELRSCDVGVSLERMFFCPDFGERLEEKDGKTFIIVTKAFSPVLTAPIPYPQPQFYEGERSPSLPSATVS